MEWIFIAFLVASILHMTEEYFYPGGFMDFMGRLNPRFAPLLTVPAAVIINGFQLLLCIAVIGVGKSQLVFSMSLAALLFINGLVHIAGCLRVKGYAPGVVTGILLYIPLSTYACFIAISSHRLSLRGAVAAGVLGLAYQSVPITYFELVSMDRRA